MEFQCIKHFIIIVRNVLPDNADGLSFALCSVDIGSRFPDLCELKGLFNAFELRKNLFR